MIPRLGYKTKYFDLTITPKIGEVFEPFDNSSCIDILTGNTSYLTKNYCQENELNSIFIVVKEAYEDTVRIVLNKYDILITKLKFVNIKSSKTGNIYRTICK